jgi:hypothetical protein
MGELQHLALDDGGGGVRQQPQHLDMVGLDHQLEGTREQEVADQNAGLVAEHGVGGGLAAALAALVDDVVMEQRGVVDALHRRGELHMRVARHSRRASRRRG